VDACFPLRSKRRLRKVCLCVRGGVLVSAMVMPQRLASSAVTAPRLLSRVSFRSEFGDQRFPEGLAHCLGSCAPSDDPAQGASGASGCIRLIGAFSASGGGLRSSSAVWRAEARQDPHGRPGSFRRPPV
jgi:hypothetical protein